MRLVCLHKLIPQFKKDNNVQKLHTIVLTDGEHILCLFMTEGGMIGGTSGKLQQLTLLMVVIISNRKTGHTYELPKCLCRVHQSSS